MRKLLNKSVGLVLAVFLFVSLLVVGISKIDFSLLTVKAEYSRGSEELSDKELDELSYRTTPGNGVPEITVFTHGLGCDPSYWSHQVITDEKGKEKWVFGYRDYSMIERLRQKIGEDKTTVMSASVGFGTQALEWANTKKTADEAKSKHVSDVNDYLGEGNPAASLRAEYNQFEKRAENRKINLYNCDTRDGTGYQYKTKVDQNSATHNLQMSDVNKHIIIVFESIEPQITKNDKKSTIAQSNDYVYAQLEYILDSLSYQYCQLTGKLPTYNLIGHSRGGNTNLQYALAHPNNVASLYSMGTPYGGSAFGSTTLYGWNLFLSIAGYSKDTEYIASEKYPNTKDYNPGILDILDAGLNKSYKEYWNEHYSQYYSHIAFRPIGTYVTLDFIGQAFVEAFLNFLDKTTDTDKLINSPIVLRLMKVVGSLETGSSQSSSLLSSRETNRASMRSLQKVVLPEIQEVKAFMWKVILANLIDRLPISKEEKWAWLNVINNMEGNLVEYRHIGFSETSNYMFKDDVFINLDSQIADGYQGTDVVVKLMNAIDQKAGDDRKCTDNVGVAHNLEPQNRDIVDYIVNSLNCGITETFSYEKINGGYCIRNLNIKQEGTLSIPETYKGQPVIAIDRLSRDVNIGGAESYHSEVTKIVIPKTIKEISNYAFYGMKNLKTVEFESGSTLDKLGTGVFMNCKSLTGVILPSTVKEIGLSTFKGCSALQSFTLGKNLTSVGAGSFAGCSQLNGISVAEGNTAYAVQDGVLFNAQGTELLTYPQGKTGVSYTVPSGVTDIGAYAFAENDKLQSINLNQAIMIRRGGLSKCSALSTITANSLKYVEDEALDGSAWLNNQIGDQVILGDVLLRYQGNAATVSLQGLSSIAPYAFTGNTSLQTLKIDSTLHNIGDGAFFQCENLQNVYVENINRKVSIGLGVFEETPVKVHIPKVLQEEYKADELWDQYKESSEILSTVVHFNSNGGSTVSDGTLWYGSDVGELPVPTKRENRFIGWKYNDGTGMKFIDSSDRWMSTADTVDFIAAWEPIEYTIVLNPNGGTVGSFDGKYTSEAGKTLPTPTLEGYTFKGWYNNASFTGNPITKIESGETGNKTYYAKWQEAEYMVTLNCGYEGCPASQNKKVIYNKAFTLPVPANREGYIFNGWKTAGGMFYTDENGESTKTWDIPTDTELIADWTRKQFAIKVNSDGTIVWMTESGFSNEKVFIPYGTKFKTAEDLEKAFNPNKVSLKEGYKFQYFTLADGTKFKVWAELPDLGANESIYNIYTHFEKEIGFSIYCLSDKEANTWHAAIIKDFNEPITLPTKSKTGYSFDGWYVMDHEYNRTHFTGTHFEIGSRFNYNKMPDLSVGKEQDGTQIRLEPRFTPIKITISYVPYYGNTISPTSNIAYDSTVILPIPSERKGYAFKGWYFGSNGTGIQCTDAEGKMLSKWNKTTNTTLYAKWDLVSYYIHYDLMAGSWGTVPESDRPTSYTITTPTITLATPERTGYRFMGWYTTVNYAGARAYYITKGSTGYKVFYAKWSPLYTVSFNTGGGSSCISMTGIAGEIIKLPTSTRSYYTGMWQRSGANYSFGSSYTISGSATLTAKWTPIEYKIHYTIFGKELTPPSSESSKRTFSVERDTVFWNPTPSDTNWYVFDGWYSQTTFIIKKTDTTSYAPHEITLYGRWKYVRPGQFTVTDSGVFNQPSDWISFQKITGYTLAQLKAQGYKTITFTGGLTAWQKDDGYKYMEVYDGTGSNATHIGEWWVDHRDGKTKRVYKLNDDGSWTFNLEALTSETLCFRYTASGAFSDTWYNSDFWLAVQSLNK